MPIRNKAASKRGGPYLEFQIFSPKSAHSPKGGLRSAAPLCLFAAKRFAAISALSTLFRYTRLC